MCARSKKDVRENGENGRVEGEPEEGGGGGGCVCECVCVGGGGSIGGVQGQYNYGSTGLRIDE